MTVEQEAERLAQAIAGAGIGLSRETGAGLLAIGASLLRAWGLSRRDVLTLAEMYYGDELPSELASKAAEAIAKDRAEPEETTP